MLPQPRVTLPSGAQLLLDEVLGSGFALVGIDADPLAHSDELTALARRLDARAVRVDTARSTFGPVSRGTLSVRDTTGAFGDTHYAGTPFLLIRPDRFVLAATDAACRGRAARESAALLSLNPTVAALAA